MKNTLTLIGAVAVAIAVIAAAAIIVKKYTEKKKAKKAHDCDCECYPYGDIDPFDDECSCEDCDCGECECSWDEVPVEEDDDFGFGDLTGTEDAAEETKKDESAGTTEF